MSDIGNVLALAVLTLISTTIDDLVVLLSFCSEIEANTSTTREEKRSQYIKLTCGYMAGFTVVVVISFIGLGLSYLVQPQYIAFLGFIPMLIGIKMLYDAIQEDAHTEFYNFVRYGKKPEDEDKEGEKKEDEKNEGVVAIEEKGKDLDNNPDRVIALTATSSGSNGSATTPKAADKYKLLDQDSADQPHPHSGHPHHHHSHVPKHPAISNSKRIVPVDSDIEHGKADKPDRPDAPVIVQTADKQILEKQKSFIEETAGVKAEVQGDDVVVGDEEMGWMAKKLQDFLIRCGISKQVVIVAATTFSIGSDNIAVYISLFSQSSGGTIAITVAMFHFMTL